MIRGSIMLLVASILALQAQSQTPATTTPPSNPPAPTPVPAVVPVTQVTAPTTTIVLDSFDSVTQWTTTLGDGVEISVHPDSNGAHGKAMRVDFDFHGHGGYAVIHRPLILSLPQNYEFSFAIKGDAPTNTLEFKVIDSTGSNVWWSNNPNFQFPKDWTTITRKKRQISFAWGPTNDRDLKRFAAIEIAITAGSGGKGSVWLDDLSLNTLEPATAYASYPRITASTQAQGYDVSRTIDADLTTSWRSTPRTGGGTSFGSSSVSDTITIDFLRRREFGGMVIGWEPGRRANSYDVQASVDGQNWQTLYSVNRTSVSPFALTVAASSKTATTLSPLFRDYLSMPESDARFLRVILKSAQGKTGYGIRDISVKPLEWAATENDLFFAMAREAPRGSYPRYLSNEQSYWTVIGVDRDSAEALINEEGMIEVGRGQFSIEPFLFLDGQLVTWNDVTTSVASNTEALPLPQVVWSTKNGDIDLTINAFAAGPADSSVLYARYRVTNNSKKHKKLALFLALRPLQVNPPWQFLNLPGGVARVDSISFQGTSARVSGNKYVRSLAAVSGFGAVTFDEGNIVDWLRAGKIPAPFSVVDPSGHASAAFQYQLELGPRATSSPIDLAVPLHGGDLNLAQLLSASRGGYSAPPTQVQAPQPGAVPEPSAATAPGITLLPGQGERAVSSQLEKTSAEWREKFGPVSITLPLSAAGYTQTMRAQLADILINRDGSAIQPGSRSYSRSWIRDGSLTSTALLRLGHDKDVKDFIDWYAPYQYDNGKVPCCVDEHGATPVPENDSHGEFIYVVAEYYRHTGDKAELEKMWPHIAKAVAYMDSLRHERMTDQYTVGPNKGFYGLLPQSISHEGYSAKPMHSYWDDFFALRGFKDAAFIAKELGKPEAAQYAQIRSSFRSNLFESIRQVVISRKINYIPGSVELADFDPTSTTIAVSPGGEAGRLPGPLLTRTFDRYFQEARQRAVGARPWDSYTPYELRNVGVHVQLGQRARAHELLDFFMKDQRPAAWHQWAEVVYRDPKTPKFIGDMPHTWVGSDYIRSFLDMLAFERESDSSLVIGAGVRDEWVKEDPGIRVSNLSTEYGPLNYDMRAIGKVVTVNLRTGIRMPPGGIVVWSPLEQPILSAAVDGVPAAIKGAEVRVRKLPAIVTIRYAK